MPITQERLMAMIETTEAALTHIKTLRNYASRGQAELIAQNLNAVAARITEGRTLPSDALIINQIRDRIVTTLEILGTDIDERHKYTYMKEKAHFETHAKQNERAARYMERKRLGLIGPRSQKSTPKQAPQTPQAEQNLGSITYAEDFVPPPEPGEVVRGPKVFDETEDLPAPVPLTDELVAKLMREADEAEAAAKRASGTVHPLGYGLPSVGDDYRSRGEAPDVPLPGGDVFSTPTAKQ